MSNLIRDTTLVRASGGENLAGGARRRTFSTFLAYTDGMVLSRDKLSLPGFRQSPLGFERTSHLPSSVGHPLPWERGAARRSRCSADLFYRSAAFLAHEGLRVAASDERAVFWRPERGQVSSRGQRPRETRPQQPPTLKGSNLRSVTPVLHPQPGGDATPSGSVAERHAFRGGVAPGYYMYPLRGSMNDGQGLRVFQHPGRT